MRRENYYLPKGCIFVTTALLLLAPLSARPAAPKPDPLDFNNEQEVKLKDTADDDAQFEKELEMKLDDEPKKAAAQNQPKNEPKNQSAEEIKNDAKAEPVPKDDTGFDAFDEPKDKKPEAPAAEPEALKTETPPPPVEVEAEAPPPAMAPDEPDLQYEAKLHDIYVNFYSSKTPDTEWQTLVGSHSSEKYQIHKGDSLWNISKTLFGDGNYWPKVWSLNSKVTNPHLVTTNNQIRFMLGDESGPPAFTVTENATANTQVNIQNTEKANVQVNEKTNETVVNSPATTTNASESNSDNADNSEPDIPPPLKVSRPVLKKLPPSLPEWQDVSQAGQYDELGIDYGKRKILDVKDQLPLVGYIAEKMPEALGTIREVEVGNNMASAFQYVYILMKKGEGQVGESFLAIASRGEVQSVHESISGFLGYSLEVQGEVQLVERVDSKSGLNGEMFRALVTKIINPVSTDAFLVQGKIENIQVTERGPRSQVVSQIIGGSYFNRRQVYGNQSIAFLNRGEVDGLEEGQILPIRANRSVRKNETDVLENVRPIGWLRIIRTTPHFATALVVRVWSDVLTGDLTGSGELLPQAGQKGAPTITPKTASSKKLIEELDEDEDLGAPPSDAHKDQPQEQPDSGASKDPEADFEDGDSGF